MTDDLILSATEEKRFLQLKKVVKQGVATFVQVGKALFDIREARLYRGTHGTFVKFCKDEFNLSYSYAHRIIEASKVATKLLPISKEVPNESVVRPLVGMSEKQQKRVYEAAIDIAEAEERPVTRTDIEQAISVPKRKVEKKIVVDEIGRVIPENLIPLWKRRGEAQEHLTALTQLKSAISLAEEMRDPLYGALHYQTFLTHLDALYHSIKYALPYAVCGLCQGMTCKVCGNGMMNRLQWEQLVPAETRERIESKV